MAKALFVNLHLFKSRSFLIFGADIFRKYDKFKDKTRYSTEFIARFLKQSIWACDYVMIGEVDCS